MHLFVSVSIYKYTMRHITGRTELINNNYIKSVDVENTNFFFIIHIRNMQGQSMPESFFRLEKSYIITQLIVMRHTLSNDTNY